MQKKVFHIVNRVNKDLRVKHSEFRVFMTLISYNGSGKIFPSLETISRNTGIKSIPDISKMLKNLERFGYIRKVRRKRKPNLYEIVCIDSVNKSELTALTQKQKEQSVLFSTVIIYAGIFKRKYESGDFAFISKILKFKENDNFSFSLKCLMLLFALNSVKDKINDKNFKGILISRYRETTKDDFKKVFQQPSTTEIPFTEQIPYLKRKI